jgi:4-hydroxy-L-threonine phosphate dehydrogenase PdxA
MMKKVLLLLSALLIIGIVLFFVNMNKFTSVSNIINTANVKAFSIMETIVVENCPQNITTEEVKEVFSQAVDKLQSGGFDKEKMEVIATTFQGSREIYGW